MQSLEIFVCDRYTDSKLLLDWIKSNGHKLNHIGMFGDIKMTRIWKKLVRSKAPAFIIDYPVENQVDIETIESFVSHVLNNNGQWYYSPRPNEYLETDNASLIGFSEAKSLGMSTIINNIKNVTKLIISKFPEKSKKHFYSVALNIYKLINKNNSHIITSSTDITSSKNFSPKTCVPGILRNFPIAWSNWIPNKETLRRDLLDRTTHFFPHPSSIHVIVLNKCNLKCVMCPYHSPIYKASHTNDYFDDRKALNLDVFRKIAKYAGEHKIGLQFGQIEEVLMHKHFFKFLEISKEYNVPHVHVTTNGVLLDKAKAEKLANSGVTSVMFSIDSVNPETYREIRGSDLAQLEENINYFIPLAKRAGITTTGSFILQPQVIEDRNIFLEKWKGLGMDQVTFYALTEHETTTGKFIRKSGEIYDKGNRYPCASPWVQTVIFPEGEISLCCKTMTDVGWRGVVSVGSLADSSMEEIWAGERYRKVRSELLENVFNDFDVCSNCDIWSASTSLVEESPIYLRTFNETMETYQFK